MDQLDPEGYIRPEADLANVQHEYQGVPEAAAGLLAEAFGPRLHSAYLYGSLVRGNAVPGRSDVDLIAVLLAAPVDEDRARADRVERALVERFPVLFSAGVGLTHLQEIRSSAQRYSGQVFLRELAVCIRGEDLRPSLPRTKPSAAVAAGFHGDTHAVFARARETLSTSTDPEVIRRICRMASKKMVQVAFAVVMAREGAWATVLEDQAAAVGAAFPQWAEAARRAAEQGRRPVADAGVVRELLDSFGRWAEDASMRRCRTRATPMVERRDEVGQDRWAAARRRRGTMLRHRTAAGLKSMGRSGLDLSGLVCKFVRGGHAARAGCSCSSRRRSSRSRSDRVKCQSNGAAVCS
jgi:uncharacterized protein